MNKLAFVFLIALTGSAAAQWQVPTNTIPYGRGPGVVGFGSITNSGGGTSCLLNTAPPSFGPCPGATAPSPAGVVHTTGAALTSQKDFTTGIIYAANYGVLADNSTNNNTAIADAMTACGTFAASGKSCVLVFPCGVVKVSTGFTATWGMTIQGCGSATGVAPGGQTETLTYGGTLIDQSCTTCNTFTFTTVYPVIVRDIGFLGPTGATAGSFVYIVASDLAQANPNRGALISNSTFLGGYNGFTCELCGNFSITFNRFYGQNNIGIYLLNSAVLPDSGDDSIIGNTIGNYPGYPSPIDCILLATHGGIRIISNKIIACDVGIRVTVIQGLTGTLIIQANSMEEFGANGIRVEQGTPGIGYGQILIGNNQFLNTSTNTFQAPIAFIIGAALYINYVKINDNYINMGASAPVGNAFCMAIADGNEIMINNNQCIMNSVAGWGGIATAGNATNIQVLDNRVLAAGAGASQYSFAVATVFRDHFGMVFANLPANVSNGGSVFVTDADPATGPCTTGGASTGAMAFRQNAAWKCF